MSQSWEARLWAKVAGPWQAEVGADDCWLFLAASRSKFGYGRIREGGRGSRLLVASRAAYEAIHGPLAAELVVRHDCDNPLCCNPLHLRSGTSSQNLRDSWARMRRRNQRPRRVRGDRERLPTPADYE